MLRLEYVLLEFAEQALVSIIRGVFFVRVASKQHDSLISAQEGDWVFDTRRKVASVYFCILRHNILYSRSYSLVSAVLGL